MVLVASLGVPRFNASRNGIPPRRRFRMTSVQRCAPHTLFIPRARSAKFFHPAAFSGTVLPAAGTIAIEANMIKVGDLINDTYHLLDELGKGGMGIVFKARDMTLDMFVAIKFMRPEVLADRDTVERFMREARALAKLKSQHAVKVYGLGTHDGMPYIVMEHLDGIALDKYLKERCGDGRGPLPPQEAARYLSQACEAIAEAHDRGIIHRDIKPANMFLTKVPPEKTIVKVLDFGIAKMVRQMDDTMRKGGRLTETRDVIGTPVYMSPEQMKYTRDVDHRADIWSLGVVLYELVSARVPFEGDLFQLSNAIVNEPPIPRNLPPAIDAIVQRCLSKDPRNRYQSVAELALALDQVVALPAQPAASLSPAENPQPAVRGGTEVMHPPITVTVLPPVAPFAPDTASHAVTRPIEPTTPSPKPANSLRRALVIGAASGVFMAFAIGGAIVGIRAALSNATSAPAASVAAAHSEASPAPHRASVPGESSADAAQPPPSAPSANGTAATPLSTTTPTARSTATNAGSLETAKTIKSRPTSSGPRKTASKRNE